MFKGCRHFTSPTRRSILSHGSDSPRTSGGALLQNAASFGPWSCGRFPLFKKDLQLRSIPTICGRNLSGSSIFWFVCSCVYVEGVVLIGWDFEGVVD